MKVASTYVTGNSVHFSDRRVQKNRRPVPSLAPLGPSSVLPPPGWSYTNQTFGPVPDGTTGSRLLSSLFEEVRNP